MELMVAEALDVAVELQHIQRAAVAVILVQAGELAGIVVRSDHPAFVGPFVGHDVAEGVGGRWR